MKVFVGILGGLGSLALLGASIAAFFMHGAVLAALLFGMAGIAVMGGTVKVLTGKEWEV